MGTWLLEVLIRRNNWIFSPKQDTYTSSPKAWVTVEEGVGKNVWARIQVEGLKNAILWA